MLEFLQYTGENEGGGEDNNKGMVSDVEGARSLGRREILSSVRDGISVSVAVVVVVVMLIVAGSVVAVGDVGDVVLVIVVRVLRELCAGMVEVVGVL